MKAATAKTTAAKATRLAAREAAAKDAAAPVVQLSAPRPFDAKRAKQRLAGLLDADAALAAAVKGKPAWRALLLGLLDGSDYLQGLAEADPTRLLRLLRTPPDAACDAAVLGLAEAFVKRPAEADAMRILRLFKQEIALLVALADLGGAWQLEQVTEALTRAADAAINAAVDYALGEIAGRKRFKPLDPANPGRGSGLIVLAMGKYGALELNYSSDIDLVVFYDPEIAPISEEGDAGTLFVRAVKTLVKLIGERTEHGYVFRVDLRLRPDPASTPVAMSIDAAFEYYESIGQTWERAAYIKARAVAGDIAAGEKFISDMAPFVWRKYLDYGAIADVHDMKRQIAVFKGHDQIAVAGHNVKLGRGGIREIEFFVQTQQLIAGGRNPALRRRRTIKMLAALREAQWIDARIEAELADAYVFLRQVEHRIQMVADEQTHRLPEDEETLARFAAFAGFESVAAFSEALLYHLGRVQKRYGALFENIPAEIQRGGLNFSAKVADQETLAALMKLGYKRPGEANALIHGWNGKGYPALKRAAARDKLAEVTPLLVRTFARADDPDAALIAFDRFLGKLPHAVELFSLIKTNPDLAGLLAAMLGIAPRLADIVSKRPHVVDAVTEPAFFGALPDEAALTARLAESLGDTETLEDALDRARIFAQEQMVLVGARVLAGTVSAAQAGEAFARLADTVIRMLHAKVTEAFVAQHGRVKDGEVAVIALGKLGGREMTAASDLDLILLYAHDEEEPESDGQRPLYGSQYFVRLTQRLISALTAPTAEGELYAVDMRLRPSGKKGPVATPLVAFTDYQVNEAWTWEHMALTRARIVSASPKFAAEIEAVIRAVLVAKRDAKKVAADVIEMRKAIAAEKPGEDRWDLKYAPGGLVDIEFIAQHLQLVHAAAMPEILSPSTARVLERAASGGLISVTDAEILRPAFRLYHDLTQVLRLCLDAVFDPHTAGAGLKALLARAGELPDFSTLDAHLIETQAKVRAAFGRIVGKLG